MGRVVRGLGVAVAAAAALAVADGEAAAQGACVPLTNLTAIVDDSGSMRGTDPLNLRAAAMTAFVQREANSGRTLAALELGTVATGIFGPGPIGPNRGPMSSAFAAALTGDGGLTDYTAAFTLAARVNPPADGRIFLTDGVPTDAYADAHRGGPPTHVVGLNVGSAGEALLRRIASETGGLFIPLNAPGDIGPAINEITAAVSCDPEPIDRDLPLPAPGGRVSGAVGVGAADRAMSAAIFTDADITDFVFRIAERERRISRAIAFTIVWEVFIGTRTVGILPNQAGETRRCTVRRRVLSQGRLRTPPAPRLRVTCRGGSGFALIEASGRGARGVRAAVGPRLRVEARRRPGVTSSGSGVAISFTRISRSR